MVSEPESRCIPDTGKSYHKPIPIFLSDAANSVDYFSLRSYLQCLSIIISNLLLQNLVVLSKLQRVPLFRLKQLLKFDKMQAS
jgi:hypothetical protein